MPLRTIRFELQAFPGDDDGVIVSDPTITEEELAGPSEAKQFAGRLAAKIKGPVDLLYAGSEPHNERYITTMSPCQFAATGYRAERLDG